MIQTRTSNKYNLNEDEVENYAAAMAGAGCPMDQTRRFIESGYFALPKALELHYAARQADIKGTQNLIALGGARGPGKTHATLAQVGLDDCQRFAGLKVLFLRKIAKDSKESFEDLIPKIFGHVEYSYVPSNNVLSFPNGSRIILGGFQNESDIDKYIGIEYDVIVLEEATTLSYKKYLAVRGSLRSTKQGWRERMYLTANPGGIGHGWFKTEFVIPYRTKAPGFTLFIPSNYKDNPFLSEDYVRYLEELQGPMGKAWRDGDWDIFEGMSFPSWDYSRHVVKYRELPLHWSRIRGIDWGYAAPFVCLWGAKDPDTGRYYVYKEWSGKQITDKQQAKGIVDRTSQQERIDITYMDPSMWAKNRQNEKDGTVYSTADTYLDNGVIPTKADNDRLSGKRKLDQLLADLPDGQPGIVFFEGCVDTIRTIPLLVSDKNNPEDVDTDLEDHWYDAVRYLLSNIRNVQKRQEEAIKQSPFVGSRRI